MYKDKWAHTKPMGSKSTLRLMRTLGPSLASLAQSSWSLLSNALGGQDCISCGGSPIKICSLYCPTQKVHDLQLGSHFLVDVCRLHGMPCSIVSNRDCVFINQFQHEFFHHQGTHFKFSTAYHPKADGQTESMSKSLGAYLRCFTGENPKQILPNITATFSLKQKIRRG